MPKPIVPQNDHGEVCYEWLVYFAQIAYTKPQPGRSWIHAVTEAVREEMLGFSVVAAYDHKGAQAFVARDDRNGDLIVSFRGTDGIADTWTDINGWRKPGPLGPVHWGADDALDYVWLALLDTIHFYRSDDSQALYITGHSLGGMKADIFTARLVDEGIKVTATVTYGSPAAGGPVFSRVMNRLQKGRLFRVVRCADKVPRLWTQKLMLYRHIGQLIYIDSQGRVHEQIGFLPRIWDICKNLTNGIRHHNKDGYVDALEENAE